MAIEIVCTPMKNMVIWAIAMWLFTRDWDRSEREATKSDISIYIYTYILIKSDGEIKANNSEIV